MTLVDSYQLIIVGIAKNNSQQRITKNKNERPTV